MVKQCRHNKNTIRIIGGVWRGRSVEFFDSDGLRPTKGIIRETLFNWLSPYVSGSRCLDLFAGSGSLGFEAASRGAHYVAMVENNRDVVQQLHSQVEKFVAGQIDIFHQAALDYLQQTSEPFDIIFLDPPFQEKLLPQVLQYIHPWLCPDGESKVYLEAHFKQDLSSLLTDWQVLKSKQSGDVMYTLVTDR